MNALLADATMLVITALLAAIYLALPFAQAGRLFTLPVSAEWLASREAARLRRIYRTGVIMLMLAHVAVVLMAGVQHPLVVFASLCVYTVALASSFAFGWRQTLPAHLPHLQTRSASLTFAPQRSPALLVALCATLPPALVATALAAHYPSLPASFPTQIRDGGAPVHMVARSPVSVFALPAIGVLVALALAALLWSLENRAAGIPDSGRYRRVTAGIVLAAAWLAAGTCAAAGLVPLLWPAAVPGYLLFLGMGIPVAVLCLVVVSFAVLTRSAPLLAPVQDVTNATHWHGGLVYWNPSDPALFVPKRFGLGWTLNFGRPAAWLILALVVSLAIAPLWFVRK